MDDLLRRQWQDLRAWLEDVDALGRADVPTGLGDWTVGDLVAHLGLGLRLVTGITPAQEGTVPISLREYVAAYPPAATAIAGQTEELQVELGEDVLAGLDRIAGEAFEHLAGIATPVVLARRGPDHPRRLRADPAPRAGGARRRPRPGPGRPAPPGRP